MVSSETATTLSMTEWLSCRWLRTCSEMVVIGLNEAWQRSVRHNRMIERAALWSVLQVSGASTADVSLQKRALAQFRDADARYQFEASLRTIPDLLPFTERERRSLGSHGEGGDIWFSSGSTENGRTGVADYEPELTARWYSWLWVEGDPTTRGEEPSLEAQVLAQGCAHLAQALGIILLEKGARMSAHPPII
jgi:hypothetical protein